MLATHDPDPANTPYCINAEARIKAAEAAEAELNAPGAKKLNEATGEEWRDRYDKLLALRVARRGLEDAFAAQGKCREMDPKPYPWEMAGMVTGLAVAAWLTGRALRFILKGD